MISIIDYLFEAKKEDNPTKLHWAEKTVGGLGIVAGAGTYGAGKLLKNAKEEVSKIPGFQEKMNKAINDQKEMLVHQGHDPDQVDEIQRKTIETMKKIPDKLENVGLATAGTVAGALAAHKLYKMYKNKKNK